MATGQLSDAAKAQIKSILQGYQEELNELAQVFDPEKPGSGLKLLHAERKMKEDAARTLQEELTKNRVAVLIGLETGLVVFRVDHFTTFAVIQKQAAEPIEEAIEATVPSRVTFTDVTEDIAWAQDAIEFLAGQGIIQGTGNGLYEPQRPIRRSELVRLMVKVLGLEPAEYRPGLFYDVEAADWYAPAVASAYHNRVIAGYPDKSFRPDHNISRNEIAVIMYQSQTKHDDLHSVQPPYNDLAVIPEWALNGIKYVCKQGLMAGYEDGTFRGDQPLTRAEAAVVVYQYLHSPGTQFPGTESIPREMR